MRNKIVIFFIGILLFSCQKKDSNSYWSIAYKNNTAGNVILGSKQQLIEAIRKGASVKIGWGTKGESHEIEHVSEPIWLAILDGKVVVAHLEPQVLSKTDWENLTANYSDSTLVKSEWRVAITTKGEFDAIWYDRQHHQVTERRPQKHIITWFIKDGDTKITAAPLFNELPQHRPYLSY